MKKDLVRTLSLCTGAFLCMPSIFSGSRTTHPVPIAEALGPQAAARTSVVKIYQYHPEGTWHTESTRLDAEAHQRLYGYQQGRQASVQTDQQLNRSGRTAVIVPPSNTASPSYNDSTEQRDFTLHEHNQRSEPVRVAQVESGETKSSAYDAAADPEEGQSKRQQEQPERTTTESVTTNEAAGAQQPETSSPTEKAAPAQSPSGQVSAPSAGLGTSTTQKEIKESAGSQSSKVPQSAETESTEPEQKHPEAAEAEQRGAVQSSDVTEPQTRESETIESTTEQTQPEQPQKQTDVNEPSGASNEQAVAERIRAALKSDPSVAEAKNIQVTTERGKIVLRGTVSSESEKQAIIEKLKDITFDNQIQVRSDAATPQSEPQDK